ncbi:MAG: hypothetical protein PHP64_02720, partial [Actinomycetota bacterium]|nr:hypothetical protein [Actinomycetota bacterium]
EAREWKRVKLVSDRADICEEIIRFRSNFAHTGELEIPSRVFPTTNLRRAIRDSQLIVVAVPSYSIRQVAREVIDSDFSHLPVVIATKGLELGTGLLGIEVWCDEMGITDDINGIMASTGKWGIIPRHVLVLSGPNLAKEIASGFPAVSVIAGSDTRLREEVMKKLESKGFTLFGWHDPLGAQVSGALKNVYAVACGIAKARGWGDNVLASIIWRGLYETKMFVRAIGGDSDVVSTPAGIGDFVATCTSHASRNFSLGFRIAGSCSSDLPSGVAEGAQTAQEALRRSKSLGLRLRLLASIRSVMAGAAQPEDILEASCAGIECDECVVPKKTGTSKIIPLELETFLNCGGT